MPIYIIMAYSIDLRKKVIEYLGRGNSQRQAQQVFGICLVTINQWHRQYQDTGSLGTNYPCRRRRKLDLEKLISYVKEHPDAYLQEIGDAFGCSNVAVFNAFKRLGITRKKRRNATRNKTP
jgi:Transposase and inactivated derivatives